MKLVTRPRGQLYIPNPPAYVSLKSRGLLS
jgi:hypothetical protein